MKVLSLFDGISCGRIALERAGIDVERYVAYEIDEPAIIVSNWNYPTIEHKGSVEGADFTQYEGFDLVIGGSPCQGFSFAGKGLNFDDPRSKLFFEFVRAIKEVKPKYFLLENVVMKKDFLKIITGYLGVEPILINSSLVSAQSRRRYYWSNIPGIEEPEDRFIYLEDIIENGYVDRDKSLAITTRVEGGASPKRYYQKSMHQIVFTKDMRGKCILVGMASKINGHDILKRIYAKEGKSPTLTAGSGGNTEPKIAIDNLEWRKLTPEECERLQTVPVGYTEMVSKTQRYRQLGNGWTVDVIAHIFNFINLDNLL